MNNRVIKKVVISTGAVTTLAGSGNSSFLDGTGTNASFKSALGIATDGTNLYVSDYLKIRKIVISSGVVTTIAGSNTIESIDGTGTNASFFWIGRQFTSDGTYLYVTDYNIIRRVE